MGIGLESGKVLAENIEEMGIHVEGNDIILFYTDGLADLKNNYSLENSLEEFENIISANHKESAVYIMNSLDEKNNRYTENFDQYDDITLILIKRKT